MISAIQFEPLAVAFQESLQILGATAVLSLFAFPVGAVLALGKFEERNRWLDGTLALLRWVLDAAVPLIILLLILYPAPYKDLFSFSSSVPGVTAWSLGFLFALRFALSLDALLRDQFDEERDVFTAFGATPMQTSRHLVWDSRHLWIRQYFGSCAAVLTVTSGAGLTQLAYEKGYFFFQSTTMLLIGIFLAGFALLIESMGWLVGEYWARSRN